MLLVAFVVTLIVLAATNTRRVTISWVVADAKTPLVFIVVAAGVLGWLAGITTSAISATGPPPAAPSNPSTRWPASHPAPNSTGSIAASEPRGGQATHRVLVTTGVAAARSPITNAAVSHARRRNVGVPFGL